MADIFNKIYSVLETILKYTKITTVKKVPTNHFPMELKSEIFLRLPAKDLVRCRCTCKRWRDEIDSPYFTKSYTNRKNSVCDSIIIYVARTNWAMSLDFHDSPKNGVYNKLARHRFIFNRFYPIEIVGSCNGLICFRIRQRKDGDSIIRLMLLNPVTRKYYIIPPLLLKSGLSNLLNMIGFGYDNISDDYKILCVVMLISGGPHVSYEYRVYSLKADSWKSIQPRLKVAVPVSSRYCMVLSNNSLHCIGYGEDTKAKKGIYGFDLGAEEFHEVPQPNFGYNEDYFNCVLTVIKGYLHLATYYRITPNNNNNNMIELDCGMAIWVMKEYGSQQSWTKVVDHISVKELVQTCGLKYDVDYNDPYQSHFSHLSSPLAYSEDGLEILIGVGYGQREIVKRFLRCDVRNGALKKFEIYGFPYDYCSFGGHCQVMPWSSSLVQLPSTSTSSSGEL